MALMSNNRSKFGNWKISRHGIAEILLSVTLNRNIIYCTVPDLNSDMHVLSNWIQWWFFKPDTFVPGQYFRINEFSVLLNRPLVWTRKSVHALFVRTSKISGLSEPGLTNHLCSLKNYLSEINRLKNYNFDVNFRCLLCAIGTTIWNSTSGRALMHIWKK